MVWQVMDSIHHGYLQLSVKGWISRSWKRHYCAVFKKSQHGVQRLEIYPSENDFAQGRNGRHVLLLDCVSVKMVPGNVGTNISYVVQLTTQNELLALGTASQDEAKVWLDALSRSAFPVEKPPAIPSFNLVPSPTTNDDVTYDIPWDAQQIRVMLITTETSKHMGIIEGPYDLSCNSQGVVLKNDQGIVEAWDYARIIWLGYGENVCAFENEDHSVFEFKCRRSTDLYDKVRTKLRLKSNHEYNPMNIKQTYYGSYTVASEPITPSHQMEQRSPSIQSTDSAKITDTSPGRGLRGLLTRKGSQKKTLPVVPLANLEEEYQMDRSFEQEQAPARNRFSRIFRSRKKSASRNRSREHNSSKESDIVRDEEWLVCNRGLHEPNYAPPVMPYPQDHNQYNSSGMYNYSVRGDLDKYDGYCHMQGDPWHSTPSSAVPSDPQPVDFRPIPPPRMQNNHSREMLNELEQHLNYRKTPPGPPPKPILRRPLAQSQTQHMRDSVASEPASAGEMVQYMQQHNNQIYPKGDRTPAPVALNPVPMRKRLVQNQTSVSTDVW